MGFTESEIIESARSRVGNKPDLSAGTHLVPAPAILAEMRESIAACCQRFGATGVARERTFRTTPRPRLATPAAPTCTAAAGGILAAGVYSYRVAAAVGSGSTPAGPAGPAAVASAGGKVTVSWAAVPGADGYVVYGRTAVGERYLAEVDAGSGAGTLSWTDTGRAAPAGAAPTADSTGGGGYLQDYHLPTYVGDDVLEVRDVLRSGAYVADEEFFGPGEIDARGRRVGPTLIAHGFQPEVAEVIAGQRRWRHADQFFWEVVRRGADLYLRLSPPPCETEVVAVTYTSTGSSISALPDRARPAIEYAACAAILNCVLNRLPNDERYLVEPGTDRRDKAELAKMLERQRDRYDRKYQAALNRA